MAQTTRTESIAIEHGDAQKMARNMAEAVTANVEQVAEALQGGTEQLLDAVRHVPDQTPMLRLVLDGTGPAMHEMVKAEGDLAGVWLETLRDHTQLTLDTMQRLAAARDWRTALTIQSDYLRQSMTRLQEGLFQQMKLTGAMTTNLISAGGAGHRQAA